MSTCIAFTVLFNIVDQSILSLDIINKAILNFTFPKNEKINPVFKDHLIKHNWPGTATQKIWLLRLLPAILGPFVECTYVLSDNWQLLEYGVKISQTLFSTVISNMNICELRQDIDAILYLVALLNTRPSAKAKLHYIKHYPELIYFCGPPILYWCMRFEAAHKYFKKLYKITGVSKNIAVTFVKRHQLKKVLHLKAVNYPLPTTVRPIFLELCEAALLQTNLQCISSTNNLSFQYHSYAVGKLEIIFVDNIKKIFMSNKLVMLDDTWFSVGNVFNAKYNIMYHAYELCDSQTHVIDLNSHYALLGQHKMYGCDLHKFCLFFKLYCFSCTNVLDVENM